MHLYMQIDAEFYLLLIRAKTVCERAISAKIRHELGGGKIGTYVVGKRVVADFCGFSMIFAAFFKERQFPVPK